MTIPENVVYCVGCGQVMPAEKAMTIFKTGFYRTTIRMACCKECLVKSGEPANDPDHLKYQLSF